ncbi:MAG: putative Chemotaxis motD protein [Hyphomicrobiales bacterium]|nr:putative Chemotaxis motD protein [Hyphomicrobiales bacterium]
MLRAKLDIIPSQGPRAPVVQRDPSGEKSAGESFSRLVDRKSAETPAVQKDATDGSKPTAAKPEDTVPADAYASATPSDASQTPGWQAMLAQVLAQGEPLGASPPATSGSADAEVAKGVVPDGIPQPPSLQKGARGPHADSLGIALQAAPGAPAGDRLQQLLLDGGQSKQGPGTHPHAAELRGELADRKGDDEVRTVVVSNVSTTTHYPVVADPIRQIVSEVSREVTASTASNSAQPADVTPGQQSTKTLHVQLEPESLGSVTVRMRLSGARLSIQLDVARPETLAMITRQQDVLHRSLGSEHCHVDSLTIRAAVAADAPAASQGAQSGTSQDSGRNSASQQGDAAAFAGSRSNGQRERQDTPERLQNEEISGASDRAAAARGLYL